MARTVVIPYGPRRIFMPYHRRAQRWACIVAHRRAGKTVACINDMVKRAVTYGQPHGRYAYVAPFLAQAKEVAWDYLKRYAQPIIKDKNEGELWAELINGARVRIHGADNPDRLRGPYLDGLIADEYADWRPSVWGEVIRPMLTDRQGWATFIGTPKGHNAFYDMWAGSGARAGAKDDPTWFTAMLKASETGILPADELAAARADMTPEQYEQEFECSFEAAILGAYFGREMAEAERAGRICGVPYDADYPVYTVWDLGKGAHMPVWVWQIVGDWVHVIDYVEGEHSDGILQVLKKVDDLGYPIEADYVPHDARATEISTGRTRIETMLKAKRNARLVADHKEMDGINAARLTIPRCRFDRVRTADGCEALRQFRADYDEVHKTFRDAPLKNWAKHPADAFRYLSMAWRELAARPAAPVGRMVETPRGQVFVADVVKEEPTLDRLWELNERRRGVGRI